MKHEGRFTTSGEIHPVAVSREDRVANGSQQRESREQPENGPQTQQQRRRPDHADAMSSPTAGGFPHRRSDSGLEDSSPPGSAKLHQAPRSRPIGRRRTATRKTALDNRSTVPTTAREGKSRPRTAWELSQLIRPLPIRNCRTARRSAGLQPHSPALIEYVYRSRYVIASQVQRRFPDRIGSHRTALWQLAGLVSLGYLATAPVRSTSPNFPFVYFATRKGVRLIEETYAQHGREVSLSPGEGRKARGVALHSLLHELCLTEFELTLHTAVGKRADLRLPFTERRYFRRNRRLRFDINGTCGSVVPDSGFFLTMGQESDQASHNIRAGESGLLHFVEWDNGTMSPARIREKYDKYRRWDESDAADVYLREFYAVRGLPLPPSRFRLLIIAHDKLHADRDQNRLAALYAPVLSLPARLRDRVWFSTAADLQAAQQHSPTPNGKIWIRGRDARPWIEEFRNLTERKQNGQRKRLVEEQLRTTPRHRLLPSPSTE